MDEDMRSDAVFTQSWAELLGETLNASEAYRTAAARWEGSLVLRTSETDVRRAVFLDLHHGACRGARVAADADLEEADFVIAADLAQWRRVLAGEIEPIFGIMSGKLKLTQGSLPSLLPHVAAAKELVAAAASLNAPFPETTESEEST